MCVRVRVCVFSVNWYRGGGRGGRGRFGGRVFRGGGGRGRDSGRGSSGGRGNSYSSGGGGGISSYAALADDFDSRGGGRGGGNSRDFRDRDTPSRPLLPPRDRRERSLSPVDSARRVNTGSAGGRGGGGGPGGGYHRSSSTSAFDTDRGSGGGLGGDRRDSSSIRTRDVDSRPKTPDPPRNSVSSVTRSKKNDDDSSGYESGEVSPSAPPIARPRKMDDNDVISFDNRDRSIDDGDRFSSRRFETFDDRDRPRDLDRDRLGGGVGGGSYLPDRERPGPGPRYDDDRDRDRAIDRHPLDRDTNTRPGRGGGGFEGRGGRGVRYGDSLGRGGRGRGRGRFFERESGGRGDPISSYSTSVNRQDFYGQKGRDESLGRDGPRDSLPTRDVRDVPLEPISANDFSRDRVGGHNIDKERPRDIDFRPSYRDGPRDVDLRGPSRETPRIDDARSDPRPDLRMDMPRDRERGPLPMRDFGPEYSRGEQTPPPRSRDGDRFHSAPGLPSSSRSASISGSYSSLLNNTEFTKDRSTPNHAMFRLDDRFGKRRRDDHGGFDDTKPDDKRQRSDNMASNFTRPLPDVDEFGRPLVEGRNSDLKRDDDRLRHDSGVSTASFDDRRPELSRGSRMSPMMNDDMRHPDIRPAASGSLRAAGDPRMNGNAFVGRGSVGGTAPFDRKDGASDRPPSTFRDQQVVPPSQDRGPFNRVDSRPGVPLGRRDVPGSGPSMVQRSGSDRSSDRPGLGNVARDEQLPLRSDARPSFDSRSRSPAPPIDIDRSSVSANNEALNADPRQSNFAPESRGSFHEGGRGSFHEGGRGWMRGGRGMTGRGFRGRGRGGGRFVPSSYSRNFPPHDSFRPDGPQNHSSYSGMDRSLEGDSERPPIDGSESFEQHRRRNSLQKDEMQVNAGERKRETPSAGGRNGAGVVASNAAAATSKEEEKKSVVPWAPSPPPKVEPCGVMTAMIRLADLEAQMEYAYAKHMLLVKKRRELRQQHKKLKGLPVGIEAIQKDLDELIASAAAAAAAASEEDAAVTASEEPTE